MHGKIAWKSLEFREESGGMEVSGIFLEEGGIFDLVISFWNHGESCQGGRNAGLDWGCRESCGLLAVNDLYLKSFFYDNLKKCC